MFLKKREKGIKDVLWNHGWNLPKPKSWGNRYPGIGNTEGHQTKLTQTDPWQDILYLKWQKLKVKYTLNAAREMQRVIFKRVSVTLSADFSGNLIGQKGMSWYIQSPESENLESRIFYPTKSSFRKRRDKQFLRQAEIKIIINNKPSLKEMLKGLL